MDLEGKVAVITGAASGIGRATAELFVRQGARVVATDLSEGGLRALGDDVHPVVGDVSRRPDAERMVSAAVERFGRIDVLANVAGISDRLLLTDEADDDVWDRVLAVNLTGPMYTCRAALRSMLPARSGSIVNVASIAGITGAKAGVAYTAAKHGLVGITRNIAAAYAHDGVRCNAICPGVTETGIGMGGEPSERGMRMVLEPIKSQPAAAQPVEMANVIAFLASDAASYVNGAIMVADAGWTAA